MFTYTIYRPEGTSERGEADWPPNPSFDQIHELIAPLVDGQIERVRILDPAKASADRVCAADYRDMFVDDSGYHRGRRRNEAATRLYRANRLRVHPEDDPESLPYIVGVAVLFDQVIWR